MSEETSKTPSTNIENNPAYDSELITPENIEQIITAIQHREELFCGPIPHPDILQGYENTLAGSADRVISMAEKQATHRQELEMIETRTNARDSFLSIMAAFTLCLAMILSGVIIVMISKEVGIKIGGLILSGSGIATVAQTFLKNTKRGTE